MRPYADIETLFYNIDETILRDDIHGHLGKPFGHLRQDVADKHRHGQTRCIQTDHALHLPAEWSDALQRVVKQVECWAQAFEQTDSRLSG